jgi:hypothetical protein
MKTNTNRTIATLLAATVVAGAALCRADEAEAPAVAASLDLPVLSAYVWRGQVLNDEAVLQPSLTVSKWGLSLNAWANYNLTDNLTGDPEFTEVDLTASYGFSLGPVSLSAGVVEYLFPHQNLTMADGTRVAYPGSREVFATASLGGVWVVPSVSLYYDFDEADGFYASFALASGWDCTDWLSLSASASLGVADAAYNEYYFLSDDAALNDLTVGLTATCKPTDFLAITPGLQYAVLLEGDIRDSVTDSPLYFGDTDRFVASLKASVSF